MWLMVQVHKLEQLVSTFSDTLVTHGHHYVVNHGLGVGISVL